MDFDKKSIAIRAYSPYYREALYCLALSVRDIIVIVLSYFLVFFISNMEPWKLYIAILVFYVLAISTIYYRVSILTLFEKKSCKWTVEKLAIQKIVQEASFSNHPCGKRTITKLYPKDVRMDRYKLICQNAEGKRVVLRTAMSGKKFQLIQDRIYYSLPTECKISYGKYSKIVMFYKSKELWTDQLNHLF